MCYILGAFSSNGNISFNNLLSLAEEVLLIRGRDAVGAYCIKNDGSGFSSKLFLSGDDRKKQLKEFLDTLPKSGSCLMLQTRAIPESEMIGHLQKGLKVSDTQPFDRREWVVSHNGTIATDRELRRMIHSVDWDKESTVDSIVLPYLFAIYGIEKTLRDLVDGSFAIAARNEIDPRGNSVFCLAKNFQPLFYDLTDGVLIYSSLPTEYSKETFPAYKLLQLHQDRPYWSSLYREETDKSVIVVHSSGLDSTTALRLFQVLGYRVAALHFEYGQQAETVEKHCSKMICDVLGIPWHCMRFPTEGFDSPLLAKEKPVLDALWDAESTFSYVPQRNLIMASIALALAEQQNFSSISLGYNLSDGSGYADNCVPFVQTLNELTAYSSNWQTRLSISAPLINLMKSEILQIGLKIGVPFERVCSCYYPKLTSDGYPIYCGDCGCETLYKYAWFKLGYYPPNFGLEGLKGEWKEPPFVVPDRSLHLPLDEIPYGYVIKETI